MKIRRAFLLFVAVWISTLLLVAQPTSDDTIYDQVRIRLVSDREVRGTNIEVKVENGVVEISGKGRNEKSRHRAEKLTRQVKGVQKVVNKLAVATTT